jgi:hypothetical protein
MIRTEILAEFIIAQLIARYKEPTVEVSFYAYMDAYPLEKGDFIAFDTPFGGYRDAEGEILTIKRRFGSGKNKQMNFFQITVRNPTPPYAKAWQFDLARITENLEVVTAASKYPEDVAEIVENLFIDTDKKLPLDTMEISEQITHSYPSVGYGNAPYGDYGYGI